jgi:lipopolysaccharide transport system ATP-binding protein
MSDVAIRVEGLSKLYKIGKLQNRYDTLRDRIADARLFNIFKRRNGNSSNGNPHHSSLITHHSSSSHHSSLITHHSALSDTQPPTPDPPSDTLWALRDVSFEVKPGEVVGIIGRNGAGKSTLLKILSRITEPTEGYADIHGRVGSLLEVGTGFHPELTGRENIYLNGSILGMKRAEINKKFDEIVAFAEIEKFIDTPVKHYSSGMYVRLAFAVAAHLDPEILLVDEVLAVGDIDFQKKCIGSMRAVAESGRTVLLVSHNLALIESLCNRALLLADGRVANAGTTAKVVSDYSSKSQVWELEDLTRIPRKGGNSSTRFFSVRILDEEGHACRDFRAGEQICLRIGVEVGSPLSQPWVGIRFLTPANQLVCHIANREAGYQLPPISCRSEIECRVSSLNLLPGRYIVDLILADMLNRTYDDVSGAAYFDVRKADVFQSGMPMGQEYGLVFFQSQWQLVEQQKRHGD